VPRLHFRLLDFGGVIAAIAMSLMAVVASIYHTRELYLLETRR
jgi:hypothetical protein